MQSSPISAMQGQVLLEIELVSTRVVGTKGYAAPEYVATGQYIHLVILCHPPLSI